VTRGFLPEFDESGALDVDEFERLDDLLSRDAARMNVEALDGYFAALVCAPRQASTGLRFGPVFAVDVFADAALGDDAPWVERLLWRHWRTIDFTLRTALEDPAVDYQPLLFEDDTGAIAGNDWAQGFLRGLADDPRAWAGFTEASPGALDGVQRLAAEPQAGPRVDAAERDVLIAGIAAVLVAAYRHFEPVRG